jgi:hypothetical protein
MPEIAQPLDPQPMVRSEAPSARIPARTRFQTLRLVLAAYGLLAASGAPVCAVITLDANFDEGALKSYSVVGSNVNLVGRDTYSGSGHNVGSGYWRWVYFRAQGVSGLQPTFSLSSTLFGGDSTPGLHELTDHQMVYSYDGEHWDYFANHSINNGVYSFSGNGSFTQDAVYVAYAFPYTYQRTVDHTAAVLASPWAAPTASGDAAGVIGQSPAGVDDLGRTIPARNLYGYRITNPATDSPTVAKRRVLLTTGQHAAETLGIHAFEGMVDWLLSDDPRAAALRDRAEFFCYPSLNSSGRYAGLTRAMLEAPNTDSNGFWDPTRWGSRTEQRLLGEAIMTDVAATPGVGLDVSLDLHSSVPDYTIAGPNGQGSGGRDDWAYLNYTQNDQLDPWWTAVKSLQPNILEVASGNGSYTMAGFARRILGARIEVTQESQFAISRPIEYYHDLGANFARAMYEAWVRVANPAAADFDEDGQVDAADLAAWRGGAGLATGAAHYQGDANGDGTVDGADFLIWQRQSFVALAATGSVPEPPTAALATVLATLMAATRVRPRG